MLKLEYPAFIAHGKAFDLVVQAAWGVIAPQRQWQAAVEKLELIDHRLYANALRWHMQLYWPGDAQQTESAEAAFRAEGCVAPARLMDLLIPLPHRRVDKQTGSSSSR
jgi:hypothetical protein